MKKKLLIFVLCLVYAGTYAQTRRRTTVRKRTTARTATAKPKIAPANSQAMVDTSNVKFVRPQDGYYKPQDGYYKKTSILEAKVTPYQYLREADVAYAKRIWREIDTRERMNQYLASPKARLIDILMDAVSKGELNAYDPSPTKGDPNGDEFSVLLKPAQAMAKMSDSVMIDQFDKSTGDKIGSRMQAGEFNPDSVVKFRLKEDWIFDKQRSVFEPRIIGIAPMIKSHAGGLNLDYQPAFWIYFPEARQILVTKEVVNNNNDATGLSFDDIFMKRIFTSYIVKQSNDKDDRIKDYAQGIDKLYESERIKKDLLNYEQDLWVN